MSAKKLGIPFSVRHIGSLLNVFFSDDPPSDITKRGDHALVTKFHLACVNRGLHIAGRGMFALSTAIDESIVDEAISHASAAMADVANEMDA